MRAIGIDGGGSHTRFVLYDEKDGVMNSVEIDASSNYHLVGVDTVKKVFKEGIERVSHGSFDVIGAGLSGVDRDNDMKTMSKIFETLNVHDFIVSNDGIAALWGATAGVGVLMIAGTGSLVIGRNARGEVHRAGGWGYMFDEYCSGFWFSNRAAVAALEQKDGLGPETTLSQRFIEFYNLNDIEDIIYLYYSNFEKSKVASAAKLVFEEAVNGDEIAMKIVKNGIEKAMEMIDTVKEKCGFAENFVFSYTGGLFKSKYFLKRIKRAFEAYFPDGDFITPKFGADVGAALMAIDSWRKTHEKIE